MKKIVTYCLVIFSLIIKTENAIAAHAVGADISYTCMGGNDYRIFFTFYRDCSGIPVSSTYNILGTSTCGGGSITIPVNLDSMVELQRACPVVTKCTNFASPNMGVEANYYHGDVTLPYQCDSWTFGMSPICNRNASITNIINPTLWCLYVEATLNNDFVQCNNSPSFSNLAVPFFCADTVQYYYQSAYDPDNDSLVFEMYSPHSNASTDVQYIAGLTGTQPVVYDTDSTTFNTTNGETRFHADGQQITIVTVRVSDYRNGVLVGSVERDMQIIFENCTSSPPIATGINETPDFSIHTCYDSLLTFHFNTSDPDLDSTFITWDHSIPGATLLVSGGLFQTGTFSWQPDSSFISSNPYSFLVTVSDHSCPVYDSAVYMYQIYVDSCGIIDGVIEQGNILEFSAVCSGDSRIIQIHYRLEVPATAVLSLYDLSGREVKNLMNEKSNLVEKAVSVAGITSGLYFLNLNTETGFSKSLKVVIE